jgi:hypothetical protein
MRSTISIPRRSVVSAMAFAPMLSTIAISNLVDAAGSPTADASERNKMSTADELAKATVRIVLSNGSGAGSGFHFIKPDIIVSAAHVV